MFRVSKDWGSEIRESKDSATRVLGFGIGSELRAEEERQPGKRLAVFEWDDFLFYRVIVETKYDVV